MRLVAPPASNSAQIAAKGSRVSLVDSAYRELKRRIMDNVYAPNSRFLEGDLADDLGMSRTPVREALIRLEKDGLIELTPRHGMRVLPLSAEDMRDIYDALTCLESTAAEMLARRKPGPDLLSSMEKAVTDMDDALARHDLDAWADADERFHRSLLENCGNRRIAAMAFGVWDVIRRARVLTLRLLPPPTQSNIEHRNLLDAVRAGDPKTARAIHERQRIRASRAIVDVLERFRLNDL